ncbi:MAG: hypothetical protein JKX85_06515 [Phycisphaeraceae bacterium]|nr:hypothetical protein [Phycisphaeraceae bacterium]
MTLIHHSALSPLSKQHLPAHRSLSFLGRISRMWCLRNKACCLMATYWVIATSLVLFTHTVQADGQQQAPPQQVPTVDWGDAQLVYDQINQWVLAGEVDQVDPLAAMPMHLVSDFGGMRVTLRWMGKTFGIGDSMVPIQVQNRQKKADLLHHARVATSGALRSLKSRMPQWNKLSPDQRPTMLVDLQIARCATQIRPVLEHQRINVLSLFSPGAQGLIFENTDRQAAWSWPATALSLNISPSGLVKGKLLEIGRKPSLEISLLDHANPIQVYRFEIIHTVKPGPKQKIVKLSRGVQILEPVLKQNQILEATWQMTANLVHRYRQDGRVARSYEPTSSRYTLKDADLKDQAMTAYALSNQMRLALKIKPYWPGYAKTSKTLRNSITYLLSQFNDHMIQREPQAGAWTLLTLINEPTVVDLKSNRDQMAAALAKTQQTNGHFTHKKPDANGTFVTQTVPRFSQALIHLALLQQYDQTRDTDYLPVLQQSAKVLKEASAKQSLMTINILFAIRDLQAKLELDFPSPIDQDRVISQTRQLLLKHQITQAPAMGPADVIGGFDLASKPSPSIAPAPDWRSAYGVSLLAAILKDPTLRPQLAQNLGLSQTELLLRSALAARFLIQLTFTAETCFYGDSPIDCIGAVRYSPWDNRLLLRATTTSLLSLQQFNDAVMQSLQQTQ